MYNFTAPPSPILRQAEWGAYLRAAFYHINSSPVTNKTVINAATCIVNILLSLSQLANAHIFSYTSASITMKPLREELRLSCNDLEHYMIIPLKNMSVDPSQLPDNKQLLIVLFGAFSELCKSWHVGTSDLPYHSLSELYQSKTRTIYETKYRINHNGIVQAFKEISPSSVAFDWDKVFEAGNSNNLSSLRGVGELWHFLGVYFFTKNTHSLDTFFDPKILDIKAICLTWLNQTAPNTLNTLEKIFTADHALWKRLTPNAQKVGEEHIEPFFIKNNNMFHVVRCFGEMPPCDNILGFVPRPNSPVLPLPPHPGVTLTSATPPLKKSFWSFSRKNNSVNGDWPNDSDL